MYIGDFSVGGTIRGTFNTRKADGSAITLAGSPTLAVYKDGGTTESTAGVTLTVGFDSRTGMHLFSIDTTADTDFYAAGSDYQVVLTAGTVDSVSVVGSKVAVFSLENRYSINQQAVRDAMALDPTVGFDIESIDQKLANIQRVSFSESDPSTPGLTLVAGVSFIDLASIQATGSGSPALELAAGSHTIQAQLIYSAVDRGILLSSGQHAIDCEFLLASGDAIFVDGSGSATVRVHHVVCGNLVEMNGGSIVTVSAESISCGTSLITASDTGTVSITCNRISTPAIAVALSGLTVTIKDAVIGGLSSAITCSAGTLELVNCYVRGSLTQSGTGVVRISNTNITGTITGTVTEYHTLTPQDVRDAMKLAPSAGAAAANSIDDKITTSGITSQQVRDAMKLAPSAGAAAANSIDDKIDSVELTVLPYTGSTPDRVAGTTITTFYKEQPSVVVDIEGASLDEKNLKFVVENSYRSEVLVIQNASITRSGSQFTVTITTAVTNVCGTYTWSIRDTSSDVVLGHGVLKNVYAAYDD